MVVEQVEDLETHLRALPADRSNRAYDGVLTSRRLTAEASMALWRDPLDDLIEDLERAVPAEPSSSVGPTMAEQQAHLVDLQVVVSSLIYPHSEADLDANQQFQDALRRFDAYVDKHRRI
jgi:hypothetical protein